MASRRLMDGDRIRNRAHLSHSFELWTSLDLWFRDLRCYSRFVAFWLHHWITLTEWSLCFKCMFSAIFYRGTASFHHVLPTWTNVLYGCLDSGRNLHQKSSIHPPRHSVLNGKVRDHRQSLEANNSSQGQGIAFYSVSSLRGFFHLNQSCKICCNPACHL